MAGPKTMHDVRSIRSVATRALPAGEGAIFLQLHRLASEKLRLEREVELWLRKKERLEKRLAEIQQQMEHLRGQNPDLIIESRVSTPKNAWRQVTVEY
ncbi:MAG: hypothetical protein EPO21_20425 [Chloroflexota bacterium]|nr:MAG: hypothetical protein EPO21_20425 [Chloroflexota bacterium]